MVARRTRRGTVPFWSRGVVRLTAWSINCQSEITASQGQLVPHIDIPAVSATTATRSITLDDMVSLRELHETRQSPDSRQLAFIVKQAFRECDCYRWALYLMQTHGSTQPAKLVEAAYLSNVQWSPDGRFVSYLSSEDGSVQLWRYDLLERRAEEVFVHAANGDRSEGRARGSTTTNSRQE
jgi:Tol biopolymer transport system component